MYYAKVRFYGEIVPGRTIIRAMLASLLAPLCWPRPSSFRRGASPLEEEAPAPPRLVLGGGGGRPAAPFTDANPLSGIGGPEAPPFWFFPNSNSAPPPKASEPPVGAQAIQTDALLSFALPAVKSMMRGGAQRAGPSGPGVGAAGSRHLEPS